MELPENKISQELLKDEKLKGARITVTFRWFFIFFSSSTLFTQFLLGHSDISRYPLLIILVFWLSNTLFTIAVRKKYNPPFLGYIGATLDILLLVFFLDGLTTNYDPTAVTAGSPIMVIPIFYLIYTFRLDRGLLVYLIIISIIGYGGLYLFHYLKNPEIYDQYISLSPLTHYWRVLLFVLIGLLCIYLQHSMSSFLKKQLHEAKKKSELDIIVRIEQQKNRFATELIEQEQLLNKKLEDEIKKKDLLARQLEESREQIRSIIANQVGAVSRFSYDEFFTARFGSDKIFDLTGYHADEFIDNRILRFPDIVYPEDRSVLKSAIDKSATERKHFSVEFRIIHKNGKIVWLHTNGQPVYDQQGNLLFFDAITTEVTEKKLAEQALLEAKQELEQLNEKLERTVEERTAKLTEANTQLLKLQKENLQSQFEVLKQQVNPHFLFNSLNVLTSLIKVDPDMAELFTERLSKVYRYVLEYKEKDLVSLRTEVDFLKSYVFLLDMRFSSKVFVNIRLDDFHLEAQVVPLVLQLLIENAIKHNTFSRSNPLKIELDVDADHYLNVINNLQNRKTEMNSTGIGLVNISKRYSLLCDQQPVFEITDNQFIAKIPLIFRDTEPEAG